MSASIKRHFEKVAKEDSVSPKSRSIERKKKFKPYVKKSLRNFILAAQKMISNKNYEQCKVLCETAIKNKDYGEIA